MSGFLDENEEPWMNESLSVIVFGSSGDLAKKKTYPALFDLYKDGALAKDTIILGYARSDMSDADFRKKMTPWLLKHGKEKQVKEFLSLCSYRHGQYDDSKIMKKCSDELRKLHGLSKGDVENRVFYFALPPSTFLDTATSVNEVFRTDTGYNRVIVEKPFGHDTDSAKALLDNIGGLFTEDEIYRIDHYLGKELVANLITLRFSNGFLEPLWNRDHISSVVITFKENFGTDGRGGYFDGYGIIRDIMQNHLMQVLSIVAMEPPVKVSGPGYSNYVRDEKVKVLNCIEPWKLENMVLGQYDGYLDDETVPKGSIQPTYCCVKMNIHNKRWDGVPFIMKAGKSLDQRKAEIRIQFKPVPGSGTMFCQKNLPRNELVIRLQPEEAIYMKTNVKRPGLHTQIMQSELNLSYGERYSDHKIYDAYSRLVLDTLRGKQATFVRDDELLAAWEIVTPVLEKIAKEKVKPLIYKFGSRGPPEADELVEASGYVRHTDYKWNQNKDAKM